MSGLSPGGHNTTRNVQSPPVEDFEMEFPSSNNETPKSKFDEIHPSGQKKKM